MRGIVVGAAALGTAAVIGAGAVVATALGGGGPQPEEVLPATTAGFVKVDLDPSAGQKLEIYRLSRKFDDLDVADEDSLKESLLAELAGELDLDPEDLSGWVGDRAAIAAVPAEGEAGSGLVPVLAVQVSDTEAMEDSLDQALADQQVPWSDSGAGYATVGDYVLISGAEQVEDIAGAEDVLADSDRFSDDADEVGDQVALAWADLAVLAEHRPPGPGMVPPGLDERMGDGPAGGRTDGTVGRPAEDLTGTVVLGARAEDDAIEVVAHASDLPGEVSEPTGLGRDLPGDAVAAVSLPGLGTAAGEAWAALSGLGMVGPWLDGWAEEAGLELPDDLVAMLGDEAALGVGDLDGAPRAYALVRTDDADRGTRALEVLGARGGLPVTTEDTDDGYRAWTDARARAALEEGPRLADEDRFTEVVAHPDQAFVYVDLAAFVDAEEASGGDAGDAAALDALGISGQPDGKDVDGVLRLTFRD